MSSELPETIKNRARKSRTVAILFGIFLPPVAYIYVGKWAWVLVNVITANYLIVGGLFIVPIHTSLSINDARKEVEQREGGDLNPS
jgi:hypothetical protein